MRLFPALALLAGLLLVASGCGTTAADEERGRALFKQNCGNCHALAQAATVGELGPDLDDAFAAARASGQTDSTIEGVVKAQVENPRPMTDNPMVSMPADIVTGQDLEDVAAYVGRWAGVPGAAPPTVPGGPGAQVFANSGCDSCHTLAAAEAGGTTGPNLDQVLVGQSAAMIESSIVEPDARITPGFPDVMPSNYESELSQEELKDLVEFLIGSGAKKGGGSK
jgi:mono/diheme cytochrome c family protein